jgi:hypothetical protein
MAGATEQRGPEWEAKSPFGLREVCGYGHEPVKLASLRGARGLFRLQVGPVSVPVWCVCAFRGHKTPSWPHEPSQPSALELA